MSAFLQWLKEVFFLLKSKIIGYKSRPSILLWCDFVGVKYVIPQESAHFELMQRLSSKDITATNNNNKQQNKVIKYYNGDIFVGTFSFDHLSYVFFGLCHYCIQCTKWA